MLGIPKEGRRTAAWRRGADKTLRQGGVIHVDGNTYASFHSPNMQYQGCGFAPGRPAGVESQPLHYKNVNAHILFISRNFVGSTFFGELFTQYNAFGLIRKGSCHTLSPLPTSLLRSSFRKLSFQIDRFQLRARVNDGPEAHVRMRNDRMALINQSVIDSDQMLVMKPTWPALADCSVCTSDYLGIVRIGS